MASENEAEGTRAPTVGEVLRAILDEEIADLPAPDRMSVLQATEQEWVVRVQPRDGEERGYIINLS